MATARDPSPGRDTKLRRLDFVDGLRAIAILTVFLTHGTEQLKPVSEHGAFLTKVVYDLNFGRLGVVTFFAISGFLIPSSVRGDRAEGALRFVISRLFRLYPVFWLSVMPSVITLYWMSGKDLPWPDIMLNFTMLPRFFGAEYANSAYWTLEVETIFYGACLFLFLGGALANQFVLACIMFVLSFIFFTSQGSILGGALNPALSADAFYLCLNLACMFWGAMCRQWWEGKRFELIPGILFWTFTGYWFVYTPAHAAYRWFALGDHDIDLRLAFGYGLGLAVFFVVLIRQPALGRVLPWIGRISYSLYLFHSPALLLVTLAVYKFDFLAGQWLEVNLMYGLALGLVFAELSHRLVEKPCIGLGRRLSDSLVPRMGLLVPRTGRIIPDRPPQVVGTGGRGTDMRH